MTDLQEQAAEYAVAELVPHSGTMSLLDDVISYGSDSLTAMVRVHPGAEFFACTATGSRGIPGWLGIEYMAQAIAAWAGSQAKAAGGKASVGFLLGSRKFSSSCDFFPVGAELTIKVERLLQDANGLGSFECSLSFIDPLTHKPQQQQARLNVFQPPNIDEFMESAKGNTHV
ncbi:hotdog family protein [Oceanobacter mangrovi]|uniref:ApeP family dehydratase n=1 Tax=Oceanobacter mangrovi TaxID=2862510 RepID=UPI001C8DE4C4|nr:hotdog family protein [Oceanobacter mangrovi]